MGERYAVIRYEDMTHRFYGVVKEVVADTAERREADAAFLDVPKGPFEVFVLFIKDERSPLGRELASRY